MSTYRLEFINLNNNVDVLIYEHPVWNVNQFDSCWSLQTSQDPMKVYRTRLKKLRNLSIGDRGRSNLKKDNYS